MKKSCLFITLVSLLTLVTLGTFPSLSHAWLAKSNFSYAGSLAASLSAGGSTLTMVSGQGTRFPQSGNFQAVIYSSPCAMASTCANREIVTLSFSGTQDIFTVIARAQEGTTTPTTWNIGSKIQAPITVGWFTEITDYLDAGCQSTTINCAAGCSPTAAQLKECNLATLTNYAQIASNVTVSLPPVAPNLGFTVKIGTAQAGNYFRVLSYTGGNMYLDGNVTGKNYVQYSAPAVGNYFSCFTLQTGASTWSWTCASGIGATSTN